MDGMMLPLPLSHDKPRLSGLYPDGDFEKSVNIGPTKKHIDDTWQRGFIAEYQQLRIRKRTKVGHHWSVLGRRWYSITEKTGKDELVETTIDLGLSGKENSLFYVKRYCEYGEELADDGNHLPVLKLVL